MRCLKKDVHVLDFSRVIKTPILKAYTSRFEELAQRLAGNGRDALAAAARDGQILPLAAAARRRGPGPTAAAPGWTAPGSR